MPLPALHWLAPNHTAISFLRNNISMSQGQYRSQCMHDDLNLCSSVIFNSEYTTNHLSAGVCPRLPSWICGENPRMGKAHIRKEGKGGRKEKEGKGMGIRGKE